MNRGGAMPMNSPIAWAYLPSGDCTICWRRGDHAAYIFDGKQLETYPDAPLRVKVLDTIPVSPQGWTDLGHVRLLGENWVKARRQRCQACGVYS
jgi:hypothetical protein